MKKNWDRVHELRESPQEELSFIINILASLAFNPRHCLAPLLARALLIHYTHPSAI